MPELINISPSNCFQSQSIIEMQREISSTYCDHGLTILNSSSDLLGTFFHLPMRGMSLNILSYGAEVAIDAGDFENFYMLEFPMTGGVDLCLGKETYRSGGNKGTLVSPGVHVKSVWSADCSQVMLKIDKSVLRDYLQSVIIRNVDKPVVFKHEVRFDEGIGASIFAYLKYLIEQSQVNKLLLTSPLIREELENSILAMLVDQLPHNYTEAIKFENSLVLPHYVSVAYKYLKENAQKQVSNEDLARISGVSPRTLYSGFRNFMGMSPQTCLRIYRLQKVKVELETMGSYIPINEIARKWGFKHMGRFSKDFGQRFGVSPSKFYRR